METLCGVCGPGSVVGIATGYGLDGPGIESRWGVRFSAPLQTGPGTHPASCTMGTGSFPGVKRGRGVTLTPNPLLAPWSRNGRAIPLLTLWAVRPVQSLSACTGVHFTFTFVVSWRGGLKVKERCTVCHALRIVFMLVVLETYKRARDIRIYAFSVTCLRGFNMNLLELAASVVQRASLLFYSFIMFGHVT